MKKKNKRKQRKREVTNSINDTSLPFIIISGVQGPKYPFTSFYTIINTPR